MTPAEAVLAPPPAAQLPAPVDAYFERWLANEFVWLPGRGMGRLRVTEAPYDAAYFEKYEGYARTPMGRAITEARVQLVNRHTDRHVVDVGIGCGAFIEGRRGWTWGYDVNPVGVEWLNRCGRWCDPYAAPVEAVSFWDVLEHIPDPGALLANVRRWVFVSVPIVPGDGPPPRDWKHLRPDEHCWYWTRAGFVGWMASHGFELVERSDFETRLGREDVETFVFRRAS